MVIEREHMVALCTPVALELQKMRSGVGIVQPCVQGADGQCRFGFESGWQYIFFTLWKIVWHAEKIRRSEYVKMISYYTCMNSCTPLKQQSPPRVHFAPGVTDTLQFAIGQRVGIYAHECGTECGILELDTPLEFNNISDAIRRYVSLQTEKPLDAIHLHWDRCDYVRYIVDDGDGLDVTK